MDLIASLSVKRDKLARALAAIEAVFENRGDLVSYGSLIIRCKENGSLVFAGYVPIDCAVKVQIPKDHVSAKASGNQIAVALPLRTLGYLASVVNVTTGFEDEHVFLRVLENGLLQLVSSTGRIMASFHGTERYPFANRKNRFLPSRYKLAARIPASVFWQIVEMQTSWTANLILRTDDGPRLELADYRMLIRVDAPELFIDRHVAGERIVLTCSAVKEFTKPPVAALAEGDPVVLVGGVRDTQWCGLRAGDVSIWYRHSSGRDSLKADDDLAECASAFRCDGNAFLDAIEIAHDIAHLHHESVGIQVDPDAPGVVVASIPHQDLAVETFVPGTVTAQGKTTLRLDMTHTSKQFFHALRTAFRSGPVLMRWTMKHMIFTFENMPGITAFYRLSF